jgi:autoinducer 2-degrading protein
VYVVTVNVFVKPEAVEQFIPAMLDNAHGSRQEPGCLRFDVLQAEDDPSRFFLYEIYRSREAFVDHQKAAHYLRWRDTVQDWMAQPRQGGRYNAIDLTEASP